jgi:hypothetical protein
MSPGNTAENQAMHAIDGVTLPEQQQKGGIILSGVSHELRNEMESMLKRRSSCMPTEWEVIQSEKASCDNPLGFA